MKRHLLAVATLALLPAVGNAQPTAPVQITVEGPVGLIREGTTDFGPVGNAGGTYTIDPAAPTGAQTTARYTARGAALATIVVSWESSVDLCHAVQGCGTKLVFTPNLSSHDIPGYGQDWSAPITNPDELKLNSLGEHYIWLGGSVTVNASPALGLYSGTFTLTATYQ